MTRRPDGRLRRIALLACAAGIGFFVGALAGLPLSLVVAALVPGVSGPLFVVGPWIMSACATLGSLAALMLVRYLGKVAPNPERHSRQRLFTGRAEMALGLAVIITFGGVIGAATLWPPVFFGLAVSGLNQGTPLTFADARRVVSEHSDVLDRVVQFTRQVPLPRSDASAVRSLAAELGALHVRLEAGANGPFPVITYSRSGLHEIHETRLTWVPEATAARVRSGHLRLGEQCEYVDKGWWWVFW